MANSADTCKAFPLNAKEKDIRKWVIEQCGDTSPISATMVGTVLVKFGQYGLTEDEFIWSEGFQIVFQLPGRRVTVVFSKNAVAG